MLFLCPPYLAFARGFEVLFCTTVVRIHTQGLLLYWTPPPPSVFTVRPFFFLAIELFLRDESCLP